MTVLPTAPDPASDQPFSVAACDVRCLVKRHAYELALAIPHPQHASAGGSQPCLHVRVKRPCHVGGFVLGLEDVECFYEDLLRMMEYLQSERQRIGPAQPMA
jgi:hypothetical protein